VPPVASQHSQASQLLLKLKATRQITLKPLLPPLPPLLSPSSGAFLASQEHSLLAHLPLATRLTTQKPQKLKRSHHSHLEVASLASPVPLQQLMHLTSAVPASAAPEASLAASLVDSHKVHHQLLMHLTSAVPDSAAPEASLADSQEDSHKVHHQQLMLLTSAVPASAASLADSLADSRKVPFQLLMHPTSAVPASAAPEASLADSQEDSHKVHQQQLMLLTSAVPASAAPAASLADSLVDSHKVPLQLLMLLTLAVLASVAQDLVDPASAVQAVSVLVQLPELSVPQDKAHQPKMPQRLKLPQLTSPTNPRSLDDDDRQKSKTAIFAYHHVPVVF